MQNDVHMADAENIVASGCKFYCEGANMPTTNEALVYLMDKMTAVGPAKAANAAPASKWDRTLVTLYISTKMFTLSCTRS